MTEKTTEKTETKTEKKSKAPKTASTKTKSATAWKAPLEFPYAVFKTGGKQYCVSKGDHVLVEKLELDPGSEFVADEVLFVAPSAGKISLGKPFLKGASIKCEVLQQTLGPKILIRHSRRRQSSQKTLGHRQPLTRLLVKEIVA